ncbi:heat shock protein Hsp-16.1/Hsp-16.11-like [Dermatophagoides pteronyssinus]|uniref:heat shock protein Hsp-16.1/Hsp-16.11-like n=1 Tax=Dermatophagoides pteronyssinus TaxID=6956 RepID=UPI003F67138F
MSSTRIIRQLVPIGQNLCTRRLWLMSNVLAKRNFLPSRRGYDPFADIQRSFDSFFREMERSFFPTVYQLRTPLHRSIPMETIEDGQRIFKIEIDLPDFKPEDVNVQVKKGEVKIDAKCELNEGTTKQFKQISYSYSLPEDVDLDRVRSLLKTDGRLVIEAPLPALESEKKENREIPIKRIDN